MATPERKHLGSEEEYQQTPYRRDLRLVLGGQAVGQIPRQEYVPYDGANPLIDEEHWPFMDYEQLETVRTRISDSMGLLLRQRSDAEIARQWDQLIALEAEFDTLVTKITWLNGMLRDRRP